MLAGKAVMRTRSVRTSAIGTRMWKLPRPGVTKELTARNLGLMTGAYTSQEVTYEMMRGARSVVAFRSPTAPRRLWRWTPDDRDILVGQTLVACLARGAGAASISFSAMTRQRFKTQPAVHTCAALERLS